MNSSNIFLKSIVVAMCFLSMNLNAAQLDKLMECDGFLRVLLSDLICIVRD